LTKNKEDAALAASSVIYTTRTKNYCCSLIAAKHSLQYTGLSLVGWKGTFASLPHLAQTVVNISR
jgi:hypothetical protein